MKPPLQPDDEARRLETLRRYELLDTLPEPVLDDLTSLMAYLCDAPISLISVVAEKRQWFKSRVGLAASELPRDISFCGHTILQPDLFIVPDAARDDRFADNPLVTGDPCIRFYAGAPLVTPDGQALGTICVIDRVPRELTPAQTEALRVLSRQVMSQLELRRQKRELAESEERLFKVFSTCPVGLVVNRWSDRTFTEANAAFLTITGWTREEVIGRTTTELRLVEESEAARVRSLLGADRHAQGLEMTIRTKSGEIREVLMGSELVELHGAPHAVSTFVDITARKQAERRLGRLNRTYAVLSDINQLIVREREPQAILEGACRIAVEKGGFLMAWVGLADAPDARLKLTAHAGANAETLQVLDRIFAGTPLGCDFTSQALATGTHAVCNDIARDSLAAAWREAALQRGYRAMVSLPLTMEGRRGGAFNLYADQVGFFDAEELRLLDELAMDVGFALEGCERECARQSALAQLRTSEERFRELAETVHEVFWITDPAKTQMHFISAAYEKIWGRTCASLYASPRTWLDAIHPDDRARILHAMETKQTHGNYDETYRILHADGTERWIHDRAFPVRGATGEVLRLVGTAEDITERRQLEELYRQSQKMEAFGQLAGGVAHDFNNILAAMMMQAQLSATTEGLPPEVRKGLQVIRASAERGANLTRQLLLFSHKQVMQPRDLDLNEVVTSLANMLQRIIEEDVHLQLHLHPTPLLTHADAGMLDQVLMNLAVNARDAMPGGGRLLIETSGKIVDANLAQRHLGAAPGRYVCLSVSDTGGGIAPDVMPHIFEPFFTTKGPGKGTGLGLATLFGIVQQHHGWVKVQSAPGRGSVFQVFLPASETAASAATATRPMPRGGSETVLVVEDEPAIRLLTRAVLERAGYQVLEAPDGVEARRIWAQHHASIKLLFTDIVMPGGVSGHELAAQLQADNPTLRVVFTSGYSADIRGRKPALEGGLNFIQKPSSPQHLLETVRRCLDG